MRDKRGLSCLIPRCSIKINTVWADLLSARQTRLAIYSGKKGIKGRYSIVVELYTNQNIYKSRYSCVAYFPFSLREAWNVWLFIVAF